MTALALLIYGVLAFVFLFAAWFDICHMLRAGEHVAEDDRIIEGWGK